MPGVAERVSPPEAGKRLPAFGGFRSERKAHAFRYDRTTWFDYHAESFRRAGKL